MTVYDLVNSLSNANFDSILSRIYGNSEIEIMRQKARYISGLEKFSANFPEQDDVRIFSVPEFIEIAGDHLNSGTGYLLEAAEKHDIFAISALNNNREFRIITADKTAESEALFIIRSILEEFEKSGEAIAGFDMYLDWESSEIPDKSVFEALILRIVDKKSPETALAGLRFINFTDAEHPDIKAIDCDISGLGYSLLVVEPDVLKKYGFDKYVTSTLGEVAEFLGIGDLLEMEYHDYLRKMSAIIDKFSEKEAIHGFCYIRENLCTYEMAKALEKSDISSLLAAIDRSYDFTVIKLMEICGSERRYYMKLLTAFMELRDFLAGSGAVGMHENKLIGFVPTYMNDVINEKIIELFGNVNFRILNLRLSGATEIQL